MGSAETPQETSVHVVRPLFEMSPRAEELVVDNFIDGPYRDDTDLKIYTTKRIIINESDYRSSPVEYQDAINHIEQRFINHPPIRFSGDIGIKLLPQENERERAFARLAFQPAKALAFHAFIEGIDGVKNNNPDNLIQYHLAMLYEANQGRRVNSHLSRHYLYTDIAIHSLIGIRSLHPRQAVDPKQNPQLQEALRRFRAVAADGLYTAKPSHLRGYDRRILDSPEAPITELPTKTDLYEAS